MTAHHLVSRTALVAVGVFAFLALVPRSAAAQAAAGQGQALYKKYCVVCHGESGAGDGPAAAKMKQKPANLGDKALQAKLTDAQILTAITEGRKTEAAAMPPFGKKMSEADIKLVAAFVRSLAK
jgi:mono/diheme cytochrome c family protein